MGGRKEGGRIKGVGNIEGRVDEKVGVEDRGNEGRKKNKRKKEGWEDLTNGGKKIKEGNVISGRKRNERRRKYGWMIDGCRKGKERKHGCLEGKEERKDEKRKSMEKERNMDGWK